MPIEDKGIASRSVYPRLIIDRVPEPVQTDRRSYCTQRLEGAVENTCIEIDRWIICQRIVENVRGNDPGRCLELRQCLWLDTILTMKLRLSWIGENHILLHV